MNMQVNQKLKKIIKFSVIMAVGGASITDCEWLKGKQDAGGLESCSITAAIMLKPEDKNLTVVKHVHVGTIGGGVLMKPYTGQGATTFSKIFKFAFVDQNLNITNLKKAQKAPARWLAQIGVDSDEAKKILKLAPNFEMVIYTHVPIKKKAESFTTQLAITRPKPEKITNQQQLKQEELKLINYYSQMQQEENNNNNTKTMSRRWYNKQPKIEFYKTWLLSGKYQAIEATEVEQYNNNMPFDTRPVPPDYKKIELVRFPLERLRDLLDDGWRDLRIELPKGISYLHIVASYSEPEVNINNINNNNNNNNDNDNDKTQLKKPTEYTVYQDELGNLKKIPMLVLPRFAEMEEEELDEKHDN